MLTLIKSSTSIQLKITALQSLNIYLYNLKTKTHLFYLLSNKNLVEIITMDHPFSHCEFTDFYVNFLKSIASKISEHPTDLFYNNIYNHFPILYSITRFYNSPDTLVRTTVQNIVLQLLLLKNFKIRIFMESYPFLMYYVMNVCYIRDCFLQIDQLHGECLATNTKGINRLVERLVDH